MRTPLTAFSSAPTPAAPDVEAPPKERDVVEVQEIRLPPYHVILLDDDDHSYEYVIEMLVDLFGHSPVRAFKMAREVDTAGRVVVDTTTRERAELKRDQIQSYGPDWRIAHSRSSMAAAVEAAG